MTLPDSIVENFDYWNYLQQSIGYTRTMPPTVPKNPPTDGWFVDMEIRVEYLTALFEDYRRGKGCGHQMELNLPKSPPPR